MGLNRLKLSGALGLVLALGGCGGGGSSGTGSVASTPAPPVVAPVLNDAEYQASGSNAAANAVAAYNAAATGQGSRIAVIDSGVSDPLGEFNGRIDAASTGFGGNTTSADVDGHGTSVAAVAAAARNGSGIEGVAYGATILALRADTAGTCGTTGGCTFSTASIASAVDYAVAHSATVINLSLGSDSAAPAALRAAISRATTAGVIIVMSAGNEGAADPELFAQVAADSSISHGLVIIAGAHDASFASASFSNKAGIDANVYLAALGSQVRAFDQTGASFLFSGTSYSTPAIAAAVALLRSAFPNLTPAQTIDLLYRSATDAGAAGVDPIFGRGILNLTAAFKPLGTTSLAGSAIPVSLGSNATLGSAMGDAMVTGEALGKAVILDSYGRAFTLALDGTIGRQAERRPLYQAIGGDVRQVATGNGTMAVSLTIQRNPFAGRPALDFTQQDTGPAARTLAGSITALIDRHTMAAFGYAAGAAGLTRQMAPDDGGAAFLIAARPEDSPGFDARRGGAMAVRHDLGRVALTISAEQGRLAALNPGDRAPPAYAVVSAGVDRRFGPLRLAVAAGMMREQGSVLGSRFGGAFGDRGARTMTADIRAALALGNGWQAGASWRQGWTDVARSGLLADDARLDSTAFAFDLTHATANGSFGLRIAQPLRVTSGAYLLSVPVSYDYATDAVGFEQRRFDLAPTGRERMIEAAWGHRLGFGWFGASVYMRSDPGNIATAATDRGAALRLSTRW